MEYLKTNEVHYGFSESLLQQIEPESIACSIWSPPYHLGKTYEAKVVGLLKPEVGVLPQYPGILLMQANGVLEDVGLAVILDKRHVEIVNRSQAVAIKQQ